MHSLQDVHPVGRLCRTALSEQPKTEVRRVCNLFPCLGLEHDTNLHRRPREEVRVHIEVAELAKVSLALRNTFPL